MSLRNYVSAKEGLRNAMARNSAKARAAAKPATKAKPEPVASAPKPSAKWSPEIAASPAARAAQQRVMEIMDSPHFETHRALALKLIQNPKLSGSEICSMLALAGSKTEAERDAALADMQAALDDASQRNTVTASAIGTGPSRAARIWDAAYARTFGEAGE